MLSLKNIRSQWLSIAAFAVIGATALTPLSFWYARHTTLEEKLLDGDYAGAYEQALASAVAGDEADANTVGNLYYLGLGVPRDYTKAARWYARAALEGYGPAQANLGHLYSQGFGVPKDMVRTLGWYKLAQRSGYGEIEDMLKRKTEENRFSPAMIEKANEIFTSLEDVKKTLSKELDVITQAKP